MMLQITTRNLGVLILGWGIATSNGLASGQDLGIPFQQRALSGGLARAGNPHCIAPWAIGSQEKQDGRYYVGGSLALRGQGRYAHEGTWGNDYAPWYTRVASRWNHGRNYQSGGGQYESDRKTVPLLQR